MKTNEIERKMVVGRFRGMEIGVGDKIHITTFNQKEYMGFAEKVRTWHNLFGWNEYDIGIRPFKKDQHIVEGKTLIGDVWVSFALRFGIGTLLFKNSDIDNINFVGLEKKEEKKNEIPNSSDSSKQSEPEEELEKKQPEENIDTQKDEKED